MCAAFPKSVDPRRLAALGRTLNGSLPLSRMPRLQAAVADSTNSSPDYAAFELTFGRDASRRDVVEGRVRAQLRLQCQRCNGVLDLQVSSRFALGVVTGLEQASRLPEGLEPLLLESEEIDPAVLVEDELLLAMPVVPRHADGVCRSPAFAAGAEVDSTVTQSTQDNPFAVLEALKR